MKSLRSEWNYSVTLCMLQGYWKVMLSYVQDAINSTKLVGIPT
jgi:hypothetical protein